jgi:hypothetical protein
MRMMIAIRKGEEVWNGGEKDAKGNRTQRDDEQRKG